MQGLAERVEEAADAIRRQWPQRPHAGIILGTGLGGLAAEINTAATIPYDQLPHFPRTTSISHTGRLVCGELCGKNVLAMEGRVHAYEGYSLSAITFPVRVMAALGAELLIVSNACGGMNPNYTAGDIVVIDDHINLLNSNPLVGPNDDRLGPRFPDMCQPYDPVLSARALEIARVKNIVAHRGV